MGILKISSFGISDIGMVKNVNQDSFVYKIVDAGNAYAGLFAVADGVGGLKDGEVSSAIAISNLNKWWAYDFKAFYNETDKLISSLVECFTKSNLEIMDYSKSKKIRTATTLSVLLIHKNMYYIVHIGDSRVYKLTKRIEKLTIDHSCYVDKILNGKTYKQSALTQCLGNRAEINCFCDSGEISKNDIFMLCSDGVCKTIEDNEILNIVREEKSDLGKACQIVINEAKQRGETDNITLILAKISK